MRRSCGGRLQVGGTTLEAPVGKWLKVTARIDLGRRKWALAVRAEGAKQEVSSLLDLPEAFRKLSWIGFTSDADEPASWYLDDVSFRVGDL